MNKFLAATTLAAGLWLSPAAAQTPHDILNVSYDVSRELYADINMQRI
jgi:sulfate transport system substrate-binding protein